MKSAMKVSSLLLLVAIAVFCVDYNDAVIIEDGYYKEVNVSAAWEPSFVYENRGNSSVTQKITITKGVKDLDSDTKSLIAKHNVGGGLAIGDLFEILSVSVAYSYSHQRSIATVMQSEIHESKVIEHEVVIPPSSKFTRWKLDADVVGATIQYMYFIDVTEDMSGTQHIPQVLTSHATILIHKLIHFGRTVVRLKHSVRQEYMTVTERSNWPCATLGHSNRFHFLLHEDSRGIRIKTLNSMHPGYEWAYSAKDGGVYFNLNHTIGYSYNFDVNVQRWAISKAEPLYDGDEVTFRNKYYDDSSLCYYGGSTTDIYCLTGCGDKWVLEVVRQ